MEAIIINMAIMLAYMNLAMLHNLIFFNVGFPISIFFSLFCYAAVDYILG